MSSADAERAQRERARKTWSLVVLDTPTRRTLSVLRKVLRVKRFELPRLAASLPGVVRRGAHCDLLPLEQALAEAGLRCELRRSAA
jgi:hypothetical protein